MKPPSRRRIEPSRFQLKATEPKQTVSVRSFCKGWNRKDQQIFLHGLKQQLNFESELDLTELQKRVPQHSLQEIEDLIKSLKSRVVQRVYLQVQNQRREERRAKVPIESWAELVQNISGSHEKTITSAFSQMLEIAATEPCSLMHSDPPHSITIQTAAYASVHPVLIRPKPNAQPWSSLLSTSPEVTVLPSQNPKTSSQPSGSGISPNISSSTILDSSDTSFNAVDHTIKFQLDNASSSSLLEANASKTPIPKSSHLTKSPSQLESEQKLTEFSLVSTGPVSPSASLPSKTHSPAQLELSDQDCLHRPRVLKCIVNFDKIYRFINDIDYKTCNSALTSMESAVLLDMLMCLPEELPLLDCKELQHHLLQLHAQLSKPVIMPPSSSSINRTCFSHANIVDSTALTKQHRTATGACCPSEDQTSQSSVTEKAIDKEDWASAGICPLNPLLVPVTLLKRQSLEFKK
ncbi:snRNA-activating protein complex subunit 2 [Xyrauchen texanus]|uniref:snRNA-activating protein complex subunit 2 n=1 Tax=Xyrauchen texanus TaxID=154827 RepID=UPI00224242E5|nr:snRNA-activating protein complex subunit 2 [Xyrauchen texanus]XP_051973757.1 snRNA-activating protein complex subunit 2 [Xyrauchen texanus]